MAWASAQAAPAATQSQSSPPPAAKADAATEASPARPKPVVNLPISIGDEVEISVFDVPDMTTRQRVDGAGNVYLPLINAVRIAGLDSETAEALIEKRLRDGGFVKDPHVNVFVKEYAAGGISVLGEVLHPGTYPAAGPRRLWEMILAAGGTTERAGTRALIERSGSNQSESVSIAFSPVEPGSAAADASAAASASASPHADASPRAATPAQSPPNGNGLNGNVEVQAGDTILVERAGVVYVLGEVKKSAAFVMDGDSLTVMQALAKAEGATNNAALNHAILVRQNASGPERIPLNLKDVLTAKAKDVAMHDGDMLYIPGRRGRYAAASTLQTILGIATGVAVHAY